MEVNNLSKLEAARQYTPLKLLATSKNYLP